MAGRSYSTGADAALIRPDGSIAGQLKKFKKE